MQEDVIVVGGGAAGMMAAIMAARKGKRVSLYEQNEKLGKKLYITGKGRCNLTNACERERFFASVVSNSKFLYSSFHAFSNEDAIRYFEEIGLPLQVERGARVFPRSNKSSDVTAVLARELERYGVQIKLQTKVERIVVNGGAVQGVVAREAGRFKEAATREAKAVVLATGGLSYPSTGSTGDGYRWAKGVGHAVTKLSPSLVGLEVKEDYVKQWQGLSLKNVSLRVTIGGREVYRELGELLFTHFGVSGPIALSASAHIGNRVCGKEVVLWIDLKPGLSMEQLERRILRDFSQFENASIKNALNKLLPKKMIPVIISLCGISADKKIHDLTRGERLALGERVKGLAFSLSALRGYTEAVVTQGGVSVKEVNPKTMESKKVKGLYFAGELLDLDALTGGFNLQIAWSTAYVAGNSV